MTTFTKLQHIAKVGSTEPALCGEKPPNGRPWKQAPDGHPECEECQLRKAMSGLALAS